MDISKIASDLVICHRRSQMIGDRAAEWASGLLASLDNDKIISNKHIPDLLFEANDRRFRRAKNLYYLGQYRSAAFYLKDTKTESPYHATLYYMSQFMIIQADRLNMSAEGESVPQMVKQLLHKINEVISELERDLKKLKPESYLLYIYSRLLLKLNRVEQAKKSTLQSIKLDPLNWSAWELLVLMIEDRNQLKSLDIPSDWPKYFFYASAYMKLQMFEEAHDLYHNVISEYFPNSAYVKSQLAFAQNELRDIEAAVCNYKKVRAIDPFRLDGMDVFSNTLYVSQRRYELASLAHTANEIEPFRYETCFCLANFYSLRGQHDKAATYFARALKIDPNNVSAWVLMGHEFMELKRTEDAIKAYRSAVNLDRRDQRAWYGLGQLYEILKLPNISLDNYNETHKLKPYDLRITIALADTCKKLEWHDLASEYYNRAGHNGDATQVIAQD